MGHLYPIARTIADALKPDAPAARTRAEAEKKISGEQIAELATHWLTLSPAEIDAARAAVFVNASGHLQLYEDLNGAPVLALTWWRIATESAPAPAKRGKAPARSKALPSPPADPPPTEDHTDDLYFRRGRTRSRKPGSDPRQLSLFDPPEKP
jgi:hypothetical protein